MDTYDLKTRLAKKAGGQFAYKDLSSLTQEKFPNGANVSTLPVGKWVKVGDYWLLNKGVNGDLDDAWVLLVVRRNRPLLNWLVLTVAEVRDAGKLVLWWERVPGTGIVIDIWFVGDGSEGVALAALSK